jgi:hypothetical protein
MKLSEKAVMLLFSVAEHQQDVLVGIYRLVYPEWDLIEKIDGWPTINKETWKIIQRKFMEFDRVYHPDVMLGGAWLNVGFSCQGSEDLEDWEVRKAPIVLKGDSIL